MITITNITAVELPAPPPCPVTAAYARQARRCAALVKRLDAALWDHGFTAAAEPRNAGFVLELAVLERQLAEALAYVTGTEVAQVERMLDELPVEG